mmetsp:Transcript_10095/g.19529  ORF Transcript_10095/g.19529 Transcript_10095/m.19529 type:complete len:201 (-) Transcript_10095:1299-1901(-)
MVAPSFSNISSGKSAPSPAPLSTATPMPASRSSLTLEGTRATLFSLAGKRSFNTPTHLVGRGNSMLCALLSWERARAAVASSVSLTDFPLFCWTFLPLFSAFSESLVTMASEFFFASPNSMYECSLKNRGFSTPAYPAASERFITTHFFATQQRITGIPAMSLSGSSSAAGLTMSFAPITMATSVSGRSGLILSISYTTL